MHSCFLALVVLLTWIVGHTTAAGWGKNHRDLCATENERIATLQATIDSLEAELLKCKDECSDVASSARLQLGVAPPSIYFVSLRFSRTSVHLKFYPSIP